MKDSLENLIRFDDRMKTSVVQSYSLTISPRRFWSVALVLPFLMVGSSCAAAPPAELNISNIDFTVLCGSLMPNRRNRPPVYELLGKIVSQGQFYFCQPAPNWEGDPSVTAQCRVQAKQDILLLGYSLADKDYRLQEAFIGRIVGVNGITELRRIQVCADPKHATGGAD